MNDQSKVAVVTGASAGIGRAVAERLASEGWSVVLAARSVDRLDQVRQRLEQQGASAVSIPCDVSDADDLERLVAQTRERFGRMDVLVNNAGVECFEHFERLSVEQVRQTIDVNFTGAVLLTRLVLPVMLEQKSGAIINMASTAGKHCPAFGAVYGATKAALIGFTEGLRGEYLKQGITATAICPGFTTDGGIYDRMVTASGRTTSPVVGGTTAQAVARAVLKAIRTGPPEIIVNRPPMRPIMALKTAFPRLGEKLILAASRRFTQRVADVQASATQTAHTVDSAAES